MITCDICQIYIGQSRKTAKSVKLSDTHVSTLDTQSEENAPPTVSTRKA